jgi:hypothetical protein
VARRGRSIALSTLPRRVNLVEIERALALFVRKDGIVTFTFLAPEKPADSGDLTGGIESFAAFPMPSGSTDPFDTLVDKPPPHPFVWMGVNTDAAFRSKFPERDADQSGVIAGSGQHGRPACIGLLLPSCQEAIDGRR